MVIEMDHPATDGRPAKLIASPLKMSETPVSYRRPPPMLGEHTWDILRTIAGTSDSDLHRLEQGGVVVQWKR